MLTSIFKCIFLNIFVICIIYEQIREEQIDFYKLLGCTPQTVTEEDTKTLQFYEEEGSYPPRFKLSFTPIHFSAKIDCQAKIIIYGHDDNISIPIQLKG